MKYYTRLDRAAGMAAVRAFLLAVVMGVSVVASAVLLRDLRDAPLLWLVVFVANIVGVLWTVACFDHAKTLAELAEVERQRERGRFF